MIFRYCKIIRYNTQKKLESSDRANYKLANILSLVLKVFEIKFEDPFLIYQKLVLRFTVTTPFTSGIFNKQLTSYCASHCSILKKKKIMELLVVDVSYANIRGVRPWKKCSFFGKFGVLCFFCNTHFQIRPFAFCLAITYMLYICI